MNQPKIKRDPEGTRRRILLAAAEEFANGGLFGARVDQIARRAETNERMLYYYFGSKEQLFTAVLEHAFSALNEAERTLELNGIAPVEADYASRAFCLGLLPRSSRIAASHQ